MKNKLKVELRLTAMAMNELICVHYNTEFRLHIIVIVPDNQNYFQ